MANHWLGLPGPQWRNLAFALHFHPASYLHDSWIDTLPYSELIRRLRSVPKVTMRLSQYIDTTLTLEPRYWYDFSEPSTRLALLDTPSLESLFFYLGLTLRRNEISREIMGETLRTLKRTLGETALQFVLKEVPLLGTVPEFPFEPAKTHQKERLTIIGAKYCAHFLPYALVQRMALKLPFEWYAYFSTTQSTPVLLPRFVRKLIKNILPAWDPLFV